MEKPAQLITLIFLRVTKHNYGDQINGDKMARICCAYGGKCNCIKSFDGET